MACQRTCVAGQGEASDISASGSYHDLGAFISGMAGLPRIVTLHDFTITAKGDDANNLGMSIIAKTYRYKDGEA